eukprot:Em0007g1484a
MDLMLCRCRIMYCNGALVGVLPLTVISYNTTGLLPFTLYMYMYVFSATVLQSRPQALHSSWNVVLGVISAAAAQHEKDSPPGGPPDPELDTNDIVISIFINKIINLTSPLAPQTPCASFYNSPLELLVEHTAPHIHDSNKYCCLCWPWGLTATTKPTRAVQGVNNHCPG